MRSLALPHDPSEALAGLWRGPRPEEDPVEKTLADSDCSPLREATRTPYLVAWLPSWVKRQGDFLTAMTPNPCEPLHHPLLKSHFSPHDPQYKLIPCSTHTSEAHCCKARGASLGCTVWKDGEGAGGLSASSKAQSAASALCILPLLTSSFEKQTLNHAWHVPGTEHLEKKTEPIPGDLVTPSVCQRAGGGQPDSITPDSLNEQSCS